MGSLNETQNKNYDEQELLPQMKNAFIRDMHHRTQKRDIYARRSACKRIKIVISDVYEF